MVQQHILYFAAKVKEVNADMKYALQEDECGFTVLGDLIVPIKVCNHILFTLRFSARHMRFCYEILAFSMGFTPPISYLTCFYSRMILLTTVQETIIFLSSYLLP